MTEKKQSLNSVQAPPYPVFYAAFLKAECYIHLILSFQGSAIAIQANPKVTGITTCQCFFFG